MLQFSDWKNLDEKKKDSYEFGCSMVYFDAPVIKEIQKGIDPEDLYEEEGDRTFGLEDEHHTTLLYGIHDDVDDNEVMKISTQEIPPLLLHNVSAFENEKYDVLKLDVECDKLHDINKELCKLPHTNGFPDYHPHATIGYLKPGTAKKYIEKYKDTKETVTPKEIVYSKPSGEKIRKSL
jgi:2'-5' RNA ligase